ncbi:MAG: hypothetical protein AAF600_21335 [Bacteroidota bacterium]
MSIAFSDSGKYVWIWEKYRPVILKLMIASSKENPQEYQLSKHEFADTNNKRPSGYSFDLRINHGKRESDIKKSLTAQDLLYVLNSSEKAKELMENNLFEFKMDKSFVLSVSQNLG